MRPIQQFSVVPSLPEPLAFLTKLAHNLWWTWDHEGVELFRHLDDDLWERTYHNPVKMLGLVSQGKLESLAEDETFLTHLRVVEDKFRAYMKASSWFEQRRNETNLDGFHVAYFSAEFGLTECLPLYSGGLGILAGDHLKSASYIGLPLVGVGLLYQHGYFRQVLTGDGWQMAEYPINDFYNMPIRLERREDSTPIIVTVDYPEGAAYAQVWRVQVGRIPLYLLDTNIAENTNPHLREITNYLYASDLRLRIKQEMLLGIGGYRALAELGITPTVCHMNEGHAAFLAVERIRQMMVKAGFSFDQAQEATAVGNVFTTHTPVPAGIDKFPPDLVHDYLNCYYDDLGLSRDDFLALGRDNPFDHHSEFSMPVLALRLSTAHNGVSQIHGKVSRQMWHHLWRDLPQDEVPIGSITNGIHIRSWVSHDMMGLFDRYLGQHWIQNLVDDQSTWTGVDRIPDTELWRTHERRRERLIAFARARLRGQQIRNRASADEVRQTDERLNSVALTIGFARRVPTYKRAPLIFHDPDRLAKILNDPERPVQLIFAGKAHPEDFEGKRLIQEVCQFAKDDRFRDRVSYIEDYDICVARYLVQGVDVWLNNPLPPNEASGTSGMKSAANGGLNFSIYDGWWAEAEHFGGGWTIGRGEVYDDNDYQNEVDANAIYDILEKEIVPTFYDRGRDDIPHRWVERMKLAMRNIPSIFNTKRMVAEYAEAYYFPAFERWERLNADDAQRAKGLAEWKSHLRHHWSRVRIEKVEDNSTPEIGVGNTLSIRATIHLEGLNPGDVSVQIYHGLLDKQGELNSGGVADMAYTESIADNVYLFEGAVSFPETGLHGYTVRVLPHHEDLNYPYLPGFIHWAS